MRGRSGQRQCQYRRRKKHSMQRRQRSHRTADQSRIRSATNILSDRARGGDKKQCYLIEVSVLLCLSVPARTRKDQYVRTFETNKITYKLAWAKARDDAIRGNEDLGQTLIVSSCSPRFKQRSLTKSSRRRPSSRRSAKEGASVREGWTAT